MPLTLPLITIGVIAVPEQMVCVVGAATAFGIGFTVTVVVATGPVQPLALGVIVKVTMIGALVALINVPLIVPVPLAPMVPVTVATLSLVQLNTVPATGPPNTIGVIAEPEQTACGCRGPHPLILGTVNVPTLAQAPVLAVPLIQPEETITPSHLTSQRQELSLKVP